MKNQINPKNEAAGVNDLSKKVKREWKDPELIEEDYRRIEQQHPGLPGAPDQGHS